MMSIPIVKFSLLVNVMEMEHNFQMGYGERNGVSYVSTTSKKGIVEYVIPKLMSSWDIHWQTRNAKFKKHFQYNPNLKKLSNGILLCEIAIIGFKHECLTLIKCTKTKKIDM
jgi:hypothetical protein